MAQMCQRASGTGHATTDTPRDIRETWSPRRTTGTTTRPELAEVFAQFLPCCGPVVADAIAELGDVAAEIELVLLEPGDVEFLPGGAAFELAGDVFFVVADDSARYC